MANVEHATVVSKKSELLWDLGGQTFFEAIGEACWIVVLILLVVAILVMIYRIWLSSKRYPMDEKVV